MWNDGKLRFEALLEDLFTDYTINRKKSIKDLVYKLDAFLKPYFGYMLVEDITPGVIAEYVKRRINIDKVTNGTINRELSYILRAFNLGAFNGRIQFVPKIRKLKEAAPRTDYYEEGDSKTKLLEIVPDYLRAIIIFADEVGWRKSEIIRLKIKQVDLESNSIWIPPGETKNNQPRVIAMTDKVKAIIKERIGSAGDSEYVFHRNGKQIKSFRTAWEKYRAEAGLNGKTFHAWRRTAIMRYDAAGISNKVAMEFTGHKTRHAFDNYRRVAPKELQEAAKKLSEVKKDDK